MSILFQKWQIWPVQRKSITISPDPCISVRNLSTSPNDSGSRRVLTSSPLGLDPNAFRTFLKIPDADVQGLEDATADSISSTGSPTRYLNLESEILTSFSRIILDPPLPETPALNSLQFKDSYKIHDFD